MKKQKDFIKYAKNAGLTGEHGVIIPAQNVRNLNLSDELIADVKDDKFHIYAASTIDDGIEILTGVPAGKRNKNGTFPAGTINYLAYEKLKKYEKQDNSKDTNNT